MFRKSFSIVLLISILVVLDWEITGNFPLNGMKAVASSCKKLGEIIKIQDGSVYIKQTGGRWQKVRSSTNLCQGDILKTTSNPGKKATVKVKCNAHSKRERRLSADEVTGVTNFCSPLLPGSRVLGGSRRVLIGR
ncbi:hypothetical protein H6G80_24280 [Nostoc sp. FACHB-87]|uniref:hypothetical protein n=1 Tax=Nostocaceae TaxID=1162 RepID=UPI001685C8A9|nr:MULTISPECIES: hypothetical protein [Nostocaceae]MBD2457180.1 hypothetical protein [Nostoc sp. FACHB-87]MBD2478330.1 hypothetical protein [Anabaena sp. FACHB-83]